MMDTKVTNIFAILGKPGSGKTTTLESILSDQKFMKKYSMNKLVYNTTRPPRSNEINGKDYNFISNSEYFDIKSKDFIESRSYDSYKNPNNIIYYFTKKSDIILGNNYICKMKFLQFANIKEWSTIKQLESVSKIYMYPIVLEAPLITRINRMIPEITSNDDTIYDICQKILFENYDINRIKNTTPYLLDKMDRNNLFINNSKCTIDEETEQIKAFTIDKLKLHKH